MEKRSPAAGLWGAIPKRVLFAVRAVHPAGGGLALHPHQRRAGHRQIHPDEAGNKAGPAARPAGGGDPLFLRCRQPGWGHSAAAKTVLLDATPPHALEPQFPGAVEQPFSLCGCWDEELLFTRREEIVRLGREISGLHWQAVRYLSGAGALLGEVRRLAAETLNWEKSSTMCSGWLPGSCLTGANRAVRSCGCSPR